MHVGAHKQREPHYCSLTQQHCQQHKQLMEPVMVLYAQLLQFAWKIIWCFLQYVSKPVIAICTALEP